MASNKGENPKYKGNLVWMDGHMVGNEVTIPITAVFLLEVIRTWQVIEAMALHAAARILQTKWGTNVALVAIFHSAKTNGQLLV